MRTILFCLLVMPFICFAQRKAKGYFSLDPALYFKAKTDPGFGGFLSGNLKLKSELFAGLQIGAVSLPGMDGAYVPLQAKFTVIPSLNSNKVSPFMLIEPGYGIHNKTYGNSYFSYTEEGGFVFFAAAGLLLPTSAKGALTLAIGYSSFGSKIGTTKHNLEMVGVRLGVLLK